MKKYFSRIPYKVEFFTTKKITTGVTGTRPRFKIFVNLLQLKKIYRTKKHRRPLPSLIWNLSFRDFFLFVVLHEVAHLELLELAIHCARRVLKYPDPKRLSERFESVLDGYALGRFVEHRLN